jgi:hypothetical protein
MVSFEGKYGNFLKKKLAKRKKIIDIKRALALNT